MIVNRTALLIAGLSGSLCYSATLKPEWELPPQHLKDNGVNGEVILNGFWEMRASEAVAPTNVRLPHIYGKAGTNLYSRSLPLPKTWEKRRLVLEMVGQTPVDGTIYWNGKELGPIKGRAAFQEWELPPTQAGEQVITIKGGLQRGDIWLKSFTPQYSIEDSYITTSTREKRITLDLAGAAPANSEIDIKVSIYATPESKQVVKTFTSKATATKDGRWKASLNESWIDAICWSQWNPYLYAYSTEVRSKGQVLDQQLPRPFGFREVWVEGNTVYLNGVPLYFNGDTWNSLISRDGNANIAQAHAIMPLFKAEGVMAMHRVENDLSLQLCAQHGIITMAYLGGLDIPIEWQNLLKPGDAGDDGGDYELRNMKDSKLEASKESMRKRVKRWRENPAILCWSIRAPWNRSTLNSLMQGNTPDPWRYWPGNNEEAKNRFRYDVADRTIAFARTLDAHRPIGTQNSPKSDIEWSTRYLCINLDMMERAAFFDRFATNTTARPLWSAEYQEIFHGHHFIRKQPLQIPQNDKWPTIHLENAARQFGESVYLDPTDEELAKWNNSWGEVFVNTDTYQRLLAENVWFSFRGWRTSHFSGFAHWQLREGYRLSKTKKTSMDRLGLPPESEDPRHPGFSQVLFDPKKPNGHPLPGVDDRLAGGEAYKKAIAPILAYIGGGEGRNNNRDHLYVSGQAIKKCVVGVSDWPSTVHFKGTLTTTSKDGSPLASTSIDCKIEPGMRMPNMAEVLLTAPKVSARTDFIMMLALTDSTGKQHDDQVTFTVFPDTREKQKKGQPLPIVYLACQPDSLIKALEQHYQAKTVGDAIPQQALFIVGRKVFSDPTALAKLKTLDLDKAVEEGARVVILEQTGHAVMGLAMEDVRPRSTFIAAEGHPLFNGLTASDFTYWTGASNLDEGAKPITEETRLVFPKRIWHVNNENAVATRTFVRPQTGSVRALLVSGFDLMESPLLEVTHGKGRMLLCQLDVGNRYATDPVATRVVDNMLLYLSQAPAPDPAKGSIPVADAAQISLRPATYRVAKPQCEDGWGITQAELFNRESIWTNNWVTKTKPLGNVPVFSDSLSRGVPDIIRKVSGRYVMSLDEKAYASGWAAQKIMVVRSALVVNQGGSRLDGPRLSLQGDLKALYPRPWLEGFIHPYTAACW